MKVKIAAVLALILLLAPAAFAAEEAELSEIDRPVDASQLMVDEEAEAGNSSEEEAGEVIRHEG